MPQKRANPLLSRLGCATTIVILLVLGISLRYTGGGLFSPGRLSAANSGREPLSGYASHAEFEADCSMCHVPWRGVTADRCQICHEIVAEQQKNNSGIHGRLPDANRCTQCHTDHNGPEAALTHFDPATFEHDWLTDFSLEKHAVNFVNAPIDCEDCHSQGIFEARSVTCLACHQNAEPIFIEDHIALFGDDCLECHDGRDSMVDFDHQEVFPLEGAHVILACDICHVSGVFAGTPDKCSGCHQEPAVHAGAFGLDCIRCHKTNAWLPARLSYHTFPLDHGGEGKIDCQTCHTQTYVEFTCTNCHAHEPDEIRSLHIEAGINETNDCIECHPTGLEDESRQENNT